MAVDGSKIWIADKHNAVAIDEFFNVIEQVSLSQANSNDELALYVTTEFEQQTLYLDFVSLLISGTGTYAVPVSLIRFNGRVATHVTPFAAHFV